MNYDWDWSFLIPYTGALIRGVWLTIQIAFISSLLGTLLGIIIGIAYRILPGKSMLLIVNDVIRAIPLLVLLFFFYFAPVHLIWNGVPLSPFSATVLAMSLSQAVFTADLYYHAVDGINHSAVQSAESLGLRKTTVWWYVKLPDISRQILPSLIAFWIGIVKLSSLSSVIGCQDLVYVASAAGAQRYRSLEVWTLAMLVYIALILPLTLVGRKFQQSEWMKRR